MRKKVQIQCRAIEETKITDEFAVTIESTGGPHYQTTANSMHLKDGALAVTALWRRGTSMLVQLPNEAFGLGRRVWVPLHLLVIRKAKKWTTTAVSD